MTPTFRVYLTHEGGNPEPYEVEAADIWEEVLLTPLNAGGIRITAVHSAAATEAMLGDLLDIAERSRGGDPSLDPEEWYAIRDAVRIHLAALRESRP